MVLRCALKWMSTNLDRIPVAIINASLEIPDWTGIRGKLAKLARSNDPAGRGLHGRPDRPGKPEGA